MSSKKTAKTVVKSEVVTVTSKKRKRGKDSDGDNSDAEDEEVHIRLANAMTDRGEVGGGDRDASEETQAWQR